MSGDHPVEVADITGQDVMIEDLSQITDDLNDVNVNLIAIIKVLEQIRDKL